jgi:hypothetical protein
MIIKFNTTKVSLSLKTFVNKTYKLCHAIEYFNIKSKKIYGESRFFTDKEPKSHINLHSFKLSSILGIKSTFEEYLSLRVILQKSNYPKSSPFGIGKLAVLDIFKS